jgi:ATP-dependent helicase/nuclease subunit B
VRKLLSGMPPRLHLLPWDQPLLKHAVAWLADGWQGTAPLDLSELLVVVPTRQSGRRLREALAAHAAGRGQAVFPPRVVLPESLLARSGAEAGAASRLESLLAWIKVFLEVDLGEFREVFPIDPPSRTFAWALRLAGQFTHLKSGLGEAGLRLADVAQRAGDDFEEAARWRQIAVLERHYTERLAVLGRSDVQDLRLAAAIEPTLESGVGRIVVLATPDPLPLAVTVLAACARTVPVDVVVFGPLGGEALFDAWGRPHTKDWTERELELAGFEQHVHLCSDPLAQAGRMVACAQRYGTPDGLIAAGVADPDVLPFLENGLARAGFATFTPDGRAFRREAFFILLEALATLAKEQSFEAAASLARCPEVLAFLTGQAGSSGRSFSPAQFLAGLDELRRRHLPPTLTLARAHQDGLKEKFPELPSAIDELARLEEMLTGGSFPTNAVQVLGTIFSHRRLELAREADARLAEIAEVWGDMLRQVEAAAPLAGGLAPNDWWDLVLRLLGEGRRFDDKPAGAIELQGWLELLWEDAPHLLVAGVNDGRVPEAVVGDPFLPEALREKLGLKTNAARFARDAYLLAALAACRARDGGLDLLFGKTSAAGDPLRPSRLLLRCPDAGLPRRVAFLFRPAEAARASLPWRRAWRLQPRVAAPPRQISVTAFRDYLRCPFRFYLGRVLDMEAVDAEKTEWDALDFGDLCHGALETMGREPGLRDCTDAKTLRDFLLAELERTVRTRYGAGLALPLVVQLESARQRLAKAAEVQARERAEGWVIERAEWRFPKDAAFTLGGLRVRGKIDRIDRHEGTGARRVLDYKTSDTPVAPREAHCRRPGRVPPGESIPEFARFTAAGREQVWIDLQLPLYLWALDQERAGAAFPGAVACGYFHLPKAVGETGVKLWDGYSDEWQAAALRCAGAVAAAISTRRFWPPAEAVDFDEFAALFQRGTAESVGPEFVDSGGGRP